MLPSSGYNSAAHRLDDNQSDPLNFRTATVPLPFSPNIGTEGFSNQFGSNAHYDLVTGVFPQAGPHEHRTRSNQKVKSEESSGTERHGLQRDDVTAPTNVPILMLQTGDPLSVVENKRPAGGRGRGRGRRTVETDGRTPPKSGRGRGAAQGVVISLSHQGRDDALAEQAMKRRRVDGEEPLDDARDEILQGFSPNGTAQASFQRKKKPQPKAKREHHACDRCFRNKTKVSTCMTYLS